MNYTSLPEVVESVSNAQKLQTMEIQQHQMLLAKLQEQLHKEKAKEETLKEELREIITKIRFYTEDVMKKKNSCTELAEALNDAVLANASLKRKLETERMLREKEERLFEEYNERMQRHRQAVKEMEAGNPENIELERQIGIINDLEEKRDKLTALLLDENHGKTVNKVSRLEKNVQALLTAKAELQEKHKHLEQKISIEVSKQGNIKQDAEVLQKRNQAQLTRLKCQVKEAQLRNWQWSREATQLETHLQSLRGQPQSGEGH